MVATLVQTPDSRFSAETRDHPVALKVGVHFIWHRVFLSYIRFDIRSNPAYEQLHEFQAGPAKCRNQCRKRRDALLPRGTPLTVREAATYLGVSIQTVYLWVERKQIPHLRVMGRNIRFLRSDLEPFRATFQQEVGNGKT